MSILDNFARGLLGVVANFARIILSIMETIEGAFRLVLAGVGLSTDMQTVLLIFILSMILLGVMRLLGGRVRTILSFTLLLVLVHVIGTVAHSPLGSG